MLLKNEKYYLNSTRDFLTMTPYSFDSSYVRSAIFSVGSAGSLAITRVSYHNDTRPVININKDVLISSGDGTMDNPYQLALS